MNGNELPVDMQLDLNLDDTDGEFDVVEVK